MKKSFIINTSFLFLLSLVSLSSKADWNWHKRAYLTNCKRDQACAFSIANKGYLCCGSDTNNITLNDLWEYNPTTNVWTQKANLIGGTRRSAFSFSINGLGYVGGGIADSNTTGVLYGDFYAYDPTTNTWTQKANYSSTGNNVYRSAATACNGKGYLIGGRNSWSSNSSLSEYDPISNVWTVKSMFPGLPTSSGGRDGGAAFAAYNKVYFGTGRDDSFFERDFWEYDPLNNAWTRKKDFPGSGRFCGVGFNIGNLGFIGLGTDGGFLKDVYIYDAINDNWNFANNFDGAGRRNASCFVIGDSAYVCTGKSAGGTKQDLYIMYFETIEPTNTNQVNKHGISFYPNITNELFTQIKFEGLQNDQLYEIDVLNSNGQLQQQRFIDQANPFINLELKCSGTFFVNINGSTIGRIIKP